MLHSTAHLKKRRISPAFTLTLRYNKGLGEAGFIRDTRLTSLSSEDPSNIILVKTRDRHVGHQVCF